MFTPSAEMSSSTKSILLLQGVLGDCWLLSTCAALAKQEWLLHRVLDPGQVTVTCNKSRVTCHER